MKEGNVKGIWKNDHAGKIVNLIVIINLISYMKNDHAAKIKPN